MYIMKIKRKLSELFIVLLVSVAVGMLVGRFSLALLSPTPRPVLNIGSTEPQRSINITNFDTDIKIVEYVEIISNGKVYVIRKSDFDTYLVGKGIVMPK